MVKAVLPEGGGGAQHPRAALPLQPHIGAASTAGSTEAEVQQGLIAALGQEVEVLARVRHHNIVQLLAANLRCGRRAGAAVGAGSAGG